MDGAADRLQVHQWPSGGSANQNKQLVTEQEMMQRDAGTDQSQPSTEKRCTILRNLIQPIESATTKTLSTSDDLN